MDPFKVLNFASSYSKKDLAKRLDQPNLNYVREGVFSCTNSNSYLLFVDLEKSDKPDKRFHFNDFFEGEYFHWDSQTTQHIGSPKIKDIVSGKNVSHLFVRVNQKINNKTQPFVYCGRLKYIEHDPDTNYPVHLIFQSIDYDDSFSKSKLLDIYFWKPSNIGKTSDSKISFKGKISKKRKRNYKKPSITERKGLVVSRVGQGYYRQQIIEKWKGKCAVTGIGILPILIASHITRWSEATSKERLDVENGILLSPLFDSLFDRYLISFKDSGEILISKKIISDKLNDYGLSKDIKIKVSKGMIKYLKKHRKKFKDKMK